MGAAAIVTDSNSGITQKLGVELGIYVLPMPFTMDGKEYFEDINLTQEMFYEKLMSGADISTSQPAPGSVLEFWENLLKEYDEIIHMPMSSGLSASCESAAALALEFNGKVQVVDNKRISVTLRQAAVDAKALADKGYNAVKIKEYLEKTAGDSSIYIMLDTLKYLRKGGRVTPAGAALGTLLNIKPVLQIHGGKLDAYAKVRGTKQGKTTLIEAIQKDMRERFASFAHPEQMHLAMAYTYDWEAALSFKTEVEQAIPGYDIILDPLSLSVSCHIGPGALALTCTKKMDYKDLE